MKDKFLALIGREKEHAVNGEEGRIIAKMNSLCDQDVIMALYEASNAGVKIDLIVRGICCLKTGIPGVSDNITVHSIVGNYLEHSRIYYFRNGGNEEFYLSSADWMPRNLERRVEILFPVEAAELTERLRHILDAELKDNLKAYFLQPDGSYAKLDKRGKVPFGSFPKQTPVNNTESEGKIMKWILASASPRRRELLTQVGLTFEVMVSDADENIEESLSPDELVKRLSLIKAAAVKEELSAKGADGDSAVIGADTVVFHKGEILGKPKDEEDAFRMLKSLSGDMHSVYTGVTILLGDETITFANETKVVFDTISDEEIKRYIASKEPMDKAGAYGIQGLGGEFVNSIEGEYANVVGFPIGEFCHILRERKLL